MQNIPGVYIFQFAPPRGGGNILKIGFGEKTWPRAGGEKTWPRAGGGGNILKIYFWEKTWPRVKMKKGWNCEIKGKNI